MLRFYSSVCKELVKEWGEFHTYQAWQAGWQVQFYVISHADAAAHLVLQELVAFYDTPPESGGEVYSSL